MHLHSMSQWTHGHAFLGAHHGEHERRTWSVVALTAVMMVVEIVGGTMFGSIALVADGLHMGTHVAALAIAGLAYLFARRHMNDARFTLGTGKFGELAAFASAIILGMIALGIGYESVLRLLHPVAIHFREAVPIAALGLCVNLVSAWLLRESHDHGYGHAHGHAAQHDQHDHDHHEHGDHDHAGHDHAQMGHHQDSNYRAAYVHVLADALTSVLTIAGLSAAWAFGWTFMDPVVGLIGMIVILSWGLSLVRSAGGVLLDTVPDPTMAQRIRDCIETDGDRLADLHLWQLGPGHAAVIASVVSDTPQPPAIYKQRLQGLAGLSHVTIE
ncbi:MAG: CDF family Co(II)/Ni(II) efflux transporter DmeF, partial [Xanthobacteraceae bacterium]